MKTSDQDEECVLCCREISIYAVGACDHPVCYECSARMRVLCETNECPICRSNMPMVICTLRKQPYSDISQKYSLIDKKFQVIFQNIHIQKAFQLLLENRCKECDEVFHSFNKLKDHVRREHNLQYCELCAENLKIFPYERKTYDRKDLARHKRVGDPDETSHRGHPLCDFCEQRYVDSDELFRHLRREHYYCHICDADGKNHYYEDYDFLRDHFRLEHYLCEEGDCANEQFTAAFRTEIDLKAHIAVHHNKNKSKAEARQARMLEFAFTYSHRNRANGNSSPRFNRFNQHKRQNVEENSSKENKSSQQAEIESIDTQSTLEFPYLSEDGENSTNLNSMTFSRNPVPQRQKNVMSSEDFPALVSTVQGPSVNYSTSVSVTSEVTDNQSRKFNFSVHRQNIMPARAPNVSIHLSQKSTQPKGSELNAQRKETDKLQKPSWVAKKNQTSFDDDFPKLESKKMPVSSKPITYTNVVNTTVVNNAHCKPHPTVEVVSNPQGNSGDPFVIIKGKSKKKKHNRAIYMDNKTTDSKDEGNEKDEASRTSYSLLLCNNNFNVLEEEENDKYRKNMLRSNNNRGHFIVEDTWQQKVSFGKDDFPPLASSDVVRRPPGFSGPKKKAPPPPGFSANSNSCNNSAPLNISLSSIARQIVAPNKNRAVETVIPHSNYEYKKPSNFMSRNEKLSSKLKELHNYNEFKTLSVQFRSNEITAATFHLKCLDILDEKDFFDIFAELICLLPDINKQQELLDVHKKYQNNSGAVPKQKLINNNQVSVCDICYQVLHESDYQTHVSEH